LVDRKKNQASAYSKHSGYSTGQAFLVKDAVEILSAVGASDLASQFLEIAQETVTQK
jgi:hypothetical protein